MLSYENNCLVYSAILRNGDDSDIKLLQNLRLVSDTSKVVEYYHRSAKIIAALKTKPEFTVEYWDSHYSNYITDIVDSLKANNNNEAINKILTMLDSLESEVGV